MIGADTAISSNDVTSGSRLALGLVQIYLTVTLSNPYRETHRVRVTCSRKDRKQQLLEETYNVQGRSDRRVRLGGLMAELIPYEIRCCLTPLPSAASADTRATLPPRSCVDYRIPANDEHLTGPM